MEQDKKRTGLEIALVGMAGRFPGAKNIEEFWDNLKNGRESISFFSTRELEEKGIDPQLLKDTDYVKAKGVLEDIEYFDYEKGKRGRCVQTCGARISPGGGDAPS